MKEHLRADKSSLERLGSGTLDEWIKALRFRGNGWQSSHELHSDEEEGFIHLLPLLGLQRVGRFRGGVGAP